VCCFHSLVARCLRCAGKFKLWLLAVAESETEVHCLKSTRIERVNLSRTKGNTNCGCERVEWSGGVGR